MFPGLTDGEVALTSPIYVGVFFCFFLFDDSGHVQENSSMILNSGDFICCVFFAS